MHWSNHSCRCSVLVAYLAPDLAGRRHFPDELLRPFLLALAVRRLVSSSRSCGGSGPGAAVLSGGRSAGLLVRESGTAVSARCRSLPFHEPRRAAQGLHSGSLRRHSPRFLLPHALSSILLTLSYSAYCHDVSSAACRGGFYFKDTAGAYTQPERLYTTDTLLLLLLLLLQKSREEISVADPSGGSNSHCNRWLSTQPTYGTRLCLLYCTSRYKAYINKITITMCHIVTWIVILILYRARHAYIFAQGD